MASLVPRRFEALTTIQGVALVVLSICAAVAALRLGQSFLAPVCLAVFVALTLAPIVRVLSRALPRSLASAIVVLVLTATTSALAYSLTDEVSAAVRELPDIARQVRQAAQSAASQSGPFNQFQRAMAELQRLSASTTPVGQPTVAVASPPLDITRGVLNGTWDLVGLAGQTLLLLFLVFFLLASGELLKVKFVRISGDRLSRRKVTVQVIDQISVQVGNFMLYVALSGTIVGVATWLAFAAMGMPYAGLWGVAAGLLNCLPYAGPTVILAVSTATALLQFHDVAWAAGVGAVSLAITALEGMLLAPVLFGRMSRINPVAVFVGVMFWTWLWGVVGALLALPILLTIKVVADAVPDLSPVAELLGD